MQTCSEMLRDAKLALSKSWLKREKTDCNTGSVAITKDNVHASGLFESRTHLLDVTSEQSALALAVSRKDPKVSKVITVTDGEFLFNPLVAKVLGDHARRTGVPIAYEVYDIAEKRLFSCKDIAAHYNPRGDLLPQIKNWQPQDNWLAIDAKKELLTQLKDAAVRGMETHFSAGTNSRYGAAVKVGNKLYFGGVYSSYDHRLNLHAEMVAALAAIMDGHRAIEQVAIISNKFVSEVPHMCGCCRQFFSEIQEKTGKPITINAFSFDGKQKFETKLNDYLPSGWSSGAPLK